MNRREKIGLDRRIHREWLDATAIHASTHVPCKEMCRCIRNLLTEMYPDEKSSSARKKTATVLHQIWGDVSAKTSGLRSRALAHFVSSTSDERMALHWAMMVGTYPLFADVAAVVGSFLSLQDTFTWTRLKHRLVEMWGERSTLERAVQRILRSMIQWGILLDTRKRGTYHVLSQKKHIRNNVAMILMEALLLDTEQDAISLAQLLKHPAIFPFVTDIRAEHLRDTYPFLLHRQGLDTDYVELVLKSEAVVRKVGKRRIGTGIEKTKKM